ncbi:type II secretion system protein [Virgibacillus soli]|uniref:Type II secretion system protein n=1 Tax=Paracerasibacillus soli TaxID=480284 RepID=A0ABU5CRD4_9BACI|nr:type II secretion system protein [Virgibacillus soli]MDY0408431.1 type II secretion system protein [Virgibacillus soli]
MKKVSIKQYNGFTLIETIICLSILSIMLLFTIPITYTTIDKQKETQFLNNLQSDILFLQNMSINKRGHDIHVEFLSHHYLIYTGLFNFPTMRQYPNGWEALPQSMQKISFTNGYITPAGSVLFRTSTKEIRVVFPLGKGRGYIRVEE